MANTLPMPQSSANWHQASAGQGGLVPSPLYNSIEHSNTNSYNSLQWNDGEAYGVQRLDSNTNCNEYGVTSNISNSTNFHQVTDSQVDQSQLHSGLSVDLQDRELWEKFSKAQTEMIVTKTGRRMFPGYRIKLEGLNPSAQYCVLMDVVSVDQHRYKFQQGEWVVAGRGEPQVPQRFYLHPNSPCNGAKWMKDIVTFHKVKLTNSCGNSANGKFFVHSMHRYQTRIHVVRTDDVSSLHLQPMSSFEFPQTKFITVTAYQNHEVTKLKIENNPFARGFRSNGGKTKNFEIASATESSMYESNKSVTMGAAFQQIHKRWKNDVTETPTVTSQTQWTPYQAHKQLTVGANGFGYSNYCQNLMPLNEVNSNLQPTYYQPQSSPNTMVQPHQISPNNQSGAIFQPQFSPANQSNGLYQPQFFDRPQASPNQFSNSGEFVPVSYNDQNSSSFQPLVSSSNQYENAGYQPQFVTNEQTNFAPIATAYQSGETYNQAQSTNPSFGSSSFNNTQSTYTGLTSYDQQSFIPIENSVDSSFSNGQQFYIPQTNSTTSFSPSTSSPLSSHDSNPPIETLNGVSQESLNICETTRFHSSPEVTSNDEGYASTSLPNPDSENAKVTEGANVNTTPASLHNNFPSPESNLHFQNISPADDVEHLPEFSNNSTTTYQGQVDNQALLNGDYNTSKDAHNPFLQWSQTNYDMPQFTDDVLLKTSPSGC